jgi:WD40 repeat protein
VNSAVLSPDGNRILIGGDDNSAKLLDTASGRILHSFQDSNGIWSAALSPDGTRIATGSFATLGTDKSIKLWDATNGRLLRKLEGHTDGVRSVAFAMGGTHILSGSNDATIKLWNVATGQAIRTFTGHLAAIKSVVISADGTRLISANDDKNLRYVVRQSAGQPAGHTRR